MVGVDFEVGLRSAPKGEKAGAHDWGNVNRFIVLSAAFSVASVPVVTAVWHVRVKGGDLQMSGVLRRCLSCVN